MKFNPSTLIVFIFFFSFFQLSNAQEAPAWGEIKGVAFEKQEDEEILVEGAIVCLLNPKDSVVVKHTVTDAKGAFSFSSVERKNYILRISLITYNTFFKNITPSAFPGNSIDLGKIRLTVNQVLLSEVTIEGQIPEVVVKQDTLEYNTAAFKMQESAVVEDLLKRLPGIEVDEEGKITSLGKNVKRVFVDGKEFFGKDPKMATKNITVDMVETVQVIDKKSDQELLTGITDGEEETIINLTIKKGMKKGWMTNATAGAGKFVDNSADNDPRYVSNLFVSRFLDNQQITLVGNSNNINNQGFTEGGNQVRSNLRGSGRGGSGAGITNSSTAGVNVQSVINDKLKMGGNVKYDYSDQSVQSESFLEYINKADPKNNNRGTFVKSRNSDRSYTNNLNFDYKAEYAPDSLNTFVLTAGLAFNDSYSSDYSWQQKLAEDTLTLVTSSEGTNKINSSGTTVSAELTWARRFSKKGRRLNFSGNININQNSGEGTNESQTVRKNGSVVDLDQELFNTSNRNSYSFRASYIEPVWKTNNTLQFSYNLRYNNTENVRESYDYNTFTNSYDSLSATYSRNSSNNFLNQTIGVNFNSVQPKYSYNIGFYGSPSFTQSSTTRFSRDSITHQLDTIFRTLPSRNVVNFSPLLRFTYRFSSLTSMRFDYRGTMNQPSATQLDPTPTNSNPLNIRSGNAELLPSFTHNLSLRFNSYNREAQRSFTANLDFSFTRNEFINYTEYDTLGVRYTMPINENGSWNSSADIMLNTPLDKNKKFKFSTNTNISYNNQIGYLQGDSVANRNMAKTFSLRETLGLSYSKDWFYGQLRGNFRYSNTTNSLESAQKRESFNYGFTYNTQLFFPYSWTLASDFNFRATRGLSSGFNTNESVWNMEVSKQFLSKKQATVRIKWNDILQQALNIRRNVTAESIQDSESNILSSYFIVSFTYRFNQMGRNRSDRYRNARNQNGQDFQRDENSTRERGSFRSGDSRGGNGGGGRTNRN